MKMYPVRSTLFDGKDRYLPGDTVELDDGEAADLQQIDVVGVALEGAEPDPAADLTAPAADADQAPDAAEGKGKRGRGK